jgi:ankyrin repeat protein
MNIIYGNTELIWAAYYNEHTEVKNILEEDFEDKQKYINSQNSSGNTALILASRKGHTKIVRILLENGAEPTIENLDTHLLNGKNALYCASGLGHVKVVKLLLKTGTLSNSYEISLWLSFLNNYEKVHKLLSRTIIIVPFLCKKYKNKQHYNIIRESKEYII